MWLSNSFFEDRTFFLQNGNSRTHELFHETVEIAKMALNILLLKLQIDQQRIKFEKHGNLQRKTNGRNWHFQN